MARQRKKSVMDIRNQEDRIMVDAAQRLSAGRMDQQRYEQIAGRVMRASRNYLGNIRNTKSYRRATSLERGAVDGSPELRKYSQRTYMGNAKG